MKKVILFSLFSIVALISNSVLAQDIKCQHKVTKGETLWQIAGYEDIYGSPVKWQKIYEANKEIIKEPDLIFPGQVLYIPRDIIEKKIKELSSESSSKVQEAYEGLVELGSSIIPSLERALKVKERDVQVLIMGISGRIGDKDATLFLKEVLINKDMDSVVRNESAKELAKIGKSTVPLLIETLKSEDSFVRVKTARTLGEIRDKRAIPGLARILEDRQEYLDIRSQAAEAIGNIGSKTAIPPLVKVLENKHECLEIRTSVSEALGEIRNRAATPALLKIIHNRDEYSDVRCSAIEAIVKIGDREAVPDLIVCLEDKKIQVSLVRALGEMKDRRAVPVLMEILKEKPKDYYTKESGARRDAAAALGKIGDRQAVPVLIEALKDKDDYVRWYAAEALGRIGDERAVPALIKAYDIAGKEPPEQSIPSYAVTEALKRTGKPAIPYLIKALKSKNENTRIVAAEVLEEVGDETTIPVLEEALKREHNAWVRDVMTDVLEDLKFKFGKRDEEYEEPN